MVRDLSLACSFFTPHILYTKERRDSEVNYGFRLGK